MEKLSNTQQNKERNSDSERLKWLEFMRTNGWEISEEAAEKLQKKGSISVMYDLYHPDLYHGGYFPAEPESDKILLITESGYFLRDSRYLVKSDDGICVNWVEETDPLIILGVKKIPNVEDLLEFKKH